MNPFAVAEALRFDAFDSPGWLLLGALGLACVWLGWRRADPGIPWPAAWEAREAGARRTDGVRLVRHGLRAGGLLALAIVLAGPHLRTASPSEPSRGLDLVLVLDTSGSMRALDAYVDGGWRTRFELARESVARFARARVAEGDRVGLVVFGETAFTQCPLTHDPALLDRALTRVAPGIAGEATAVGDALALAVRRATRGVPRFDARDAAGETDRDGRAVARTPSAPDPSGPQEGRVVVLLTDGRSNAGDLPTDVAIEIARATGVRVHTVGIGAEGEVLMDTEAGAARTGLRFERHDLDQASLETVASATGGRFFRARRSSDLASVYTAIDSLERVEREGRPRGRRVSRDRPWLALAGLLLAAELALGRVWLREIP